MRTFITFGHRDEVLTKQYQKNLGSQHIQLWFCDLWFFIKMGKKMVFLDTTCVTTITAGTLNSFELAWSTSHLYVQTFSRSSYKLQVGLFLHCLSLQISLYQIHFYGLWSSSGNTRHALKLKNLVFLETSWQGESENRNAPRKFGHVTFWTTLALDVMFLKTLNNLSSNIFGRVV